MANRGAVGLVFALAIACSRQPSDPPSRIARIPPPVRTPNASDEPSAPARERTEPAPTPPQPSPPPAAPGIHRRAAVDTIEEAQKRDLVRDARAAWERERRLRPRGAVAMARSDVVAAEVESAIGELAVVLCEGIPSSRNDAIFDLVTLAERVLEAQESIDPRALQQCLREGGDPGNCELIDGQQYTELGEAESALEEARRRAAIDGLQAECSPGDPDLAPPAAGRASRPPHPAGRHR